jgi:hypothetical protein
MPKAGAADLQSYGIDMAGLDPAIGCDPKIVGHQPIVFAPPMIAGSSPAMTMSRTDPRNP